MSMKKKTKVVWITIAAVLLTLLALGYFVSEHIKSSPSVEQVVIPDLTGLNEDEARDELQKLNLILGQVAVSSIEDTPQGAAPYTVIRTIPAQGEEIPMRSPITIIVAADVLGEAENLVRIPGLEGCEGIVRLNLEEAGLNVRTVESPSIQVEEGWPILQYPARDTEVAEGSTVIVIISSGEPHEPIFLTMPSVIGLSVPEGATLLQSYGLEVILPMEHKHSEGTIASQTPEAGMEVLQGSAVILRVEVR